MNLLESIQTHHDICEEIYAAMLDLNRVFKAGTATPDETILDRQRGMIGVLERSLAGMRRAAESEDRRTPEVRVALERCQRTVMKALLLDRENEQLLLKNAMVRPTPAPAPKPSPNHLARVYARH
jgi:hypothetical protein